MSIVTERGNPSASASQGCKNRDCLVSPSEVLTQEMGGGGWGWRGGEDKNFAFLEVPGWC